MFEEFKTAPRSVQLSLLVVICGYIAAVIFDTGYTLFVTAVMLFLVACIRIVLFYLNGD